MPAFLDATAYPHILEAVIGYAPRATLLRLRGVSRNLQLRADERLAEHVEIQTCVDNMALRHPAAYKLDHLFPTRCSKGTAVNYTDGSRTAYLANLFRNTLVVDLSRQSDDIQIAPWIIPWNVFPNLRLLRFNYTTFERRPNIHENLSVVWFSPLTPTLCGQPQHYRMGDMDCKRMTLSVAFDPWDPNLVSSNVTSFYYEDPIEEVVLLLTPFRAAHRTLRPRNARHQVAKPRAPGTVSIRDFRNSLGVLGIIEDFVFHMIPELDRRHFLVGLEAVPPAALGLDPALAPHEISAAVRLEIRAMVLGRRDDRRDRVVPAELWPDERVEACVTAIEIISIPTYRERVGAWHLDYESEW